MKILHLNTERNWRGGEQQTLYLLQGLRKRKIYSHLACQPESPMAKRAAEAGLNIFTIIMRGEVDRIAVYQLRKLIRKFKYDIIHSHTSHAHSLVFWASLGHKRHFNMKSAVMILK